MVSGTQPLRGIGIVTCHRIGNSDGIYAFVDTACCKIFTENPDGVFTAIRK